MSSLAHTTPRRSTSADRPPLMPLSSRRRDSPTTLTGFSTLAQVTPSPPSALTPAPSSEPIPSPAAASAAAAAQPPSSLVESLAASTLPVYVRVDLLSIELANWARRVSAEKEYDIDWRNKPVGYLDSMAEIASAIHRALVEMGAKPQAENEFKRVKCDECHQYYFDKKTVDDDDMLFCPDCRPPPDSYVDILCRGCHKRVLWSKGPVPYCKSCAAEITPGLEGNEAASDDEEEDEGKLVDDEAEEASEDEPDPTSEEEDSSEDEAAKWRREELEPVMECVANLGYVLSNLEFSADMGNIPSRFMPSNLLRRLQNALRRTGGQVWKFAKPTFADKKDEPKPRESRINTTRWRARELAPAMKVVAYLGYMLNHLHYKVAIESALPGYYGPKRILARLKRLLNYAGGRTLEDTEPTFGRGSADSSEKDQGSSDEDSSDEDHTPAAAASNEFDLKAELKNSREKELAPAMKTTSYLIYMLRWLSYKNSDMDREYDPFNLVLRLEEELQQAGGRCVVARKPPFTSFVNWPHIDTSDEDSEDEDYKPAARKKPSKKAAADKDSDSDSDDDKPIAAATRKSKKPRSAAAASASKPAAKKARKA